MQQTGKLSYTYWKGFEGYDRAWGLTDKYNLTVTKLSKEALELDRQYKIRAKSLRCDGIAVDTPGIHARFLFGMGLA